MNRRSSRIFLTRCGCVALLAFGPLTNQTRAEGIDLDKTRTEAEGGNAEAQYAIGKAYAKGEGVTRDLKKAVDYYRKAADQGNAKAQTNLGVLYANGEGVEKDEQVAIGLFRKAAVQGDALGQQNLAWMLTHAKSVQVNPADAIPLYRSAAEAGQLDAQIQLGQLYIKGRDGIAQDYREAGKWFGMAAAQGSPIAQTSLGALYENGLGVEKNEDEAVKLYSLAAEKEEPRGLFNLGRVYLEGLGKTSKDLPRAYQCLFLSGNRGEIAAEKLLRDNEILGTFSKEDIEKGKQLATDREAEWARAKGK